MPNPPRINATPHALKIHQVLAAVLVSTLSAPALAHGDFGPLVAFVGGILLLGVGGVAALVAKLAPPGKKALWGCLFSFGIFLGYFPFVKLALNALSQFSSNTVGANAWLAVSLVFFAAWGVLLFWLRRGWKAETKAAADTSTLPAAQQSAADLPTQSGGLSTTRKIAVGLAICLALSLPSLLHFLVWPLVIIASTFATWALAIVTIVGLFKHARWAWQLGVVWLVLAVLMLASSVVHGRSVPALNYMTGLLSLLPGMVTIILLALLLLPRVRKECGA